MGGYGSGRYGGASKGTVEDCIVLSAAKMQHDGMIAPGRYCGGSLVWRLVSTGEQTSSIGFHVNTRDGEWPMIRLHYTHTRWGEDEGQNLDYQVGLTTTPLPWGGVRWWFHCPLSIQGRYCGRRVGKLYLPPGGRYFGCRHCYNLTYTSCRESHSSDSFYRLLSAKTGIPPTIVKRLMKC